MAHADKQRFTSQGEDMQRESIKMSKYWEEQLRAMPYLSCTYNYQLSYSPTCIIFQRKMARPSIC